MPSPLGQSDVPADWYSRGRRLDSRSGHIFHELISAAILSLSLIQVGQLSATGKHMGT